MAQVRVGQHDAKGGENSGPYELPRLTESDSRAVQDSLARGAALVNAELERLLGTRARFHSAVREAVLYSVRAGGKRLRPTLVMLAAEACLGPDRSLPSPVRVAAAAVEMIHTYSLIHDDLPAMDNDDLRRGRPTNHRVFGEALAILAGDALLNHAFTVLSEEVTEPGLAVALIRELGTAAGGAGMIGGQAADILSERGQWNKLDTGFPETGDADPGVSSRSETALCLLRAIHRHKTAALMRASLRLGALAVGGSSAQIDVLGRFGETLGMAFQVVDDILDETSNIEQLGKTAGKDRSAGKLTYPGLLGLEPARAEAARLTRMALQELSLFAEMGQDLGRVAAYNFFRTA